MDAVEGELIHLQRLRVPQPAQPNLHSQSTRGVQTLSITPHTNQVVLTLTPSDPSTPFSSWLATTESIIYSFLDEL